MKCPRCGYCDESSSPRWMWTLRYMARQREPLFGGLLPEDRYRSDNELCRFLAEGWVEIVPEKGFKVTSKGRRVAFEGA